MKVIAHVEHVTHWNGAINKKLLYVLRREKEEVL